LADPITYNFVDYPAAENGHSLAGSVTVAGPGSGENVIFTSASWTIDGVEYSDLFSGGSDGVIATPTELILTPGWSFGLSVYEANGIMIQGGGGLSWLNGYFGHAPSYSANYGWNPQDGTSLFYWDTVGAQAYLGTGDWVIATTSPVPEPSTLVLLGIGAISLLAYAWRKRRRTA